MIKKVEIDNFGCFQKFVWNTQLVDEFKKYNIIYGRNYSGKTTLSRIFRCLEKKELHNDYRDGKFRFTFKDNSSFSETEVLKSNVNIRVFNKDFIQENLSFLFRKDGEIKAFAILGESNISIEAKIRETEKSIKNYKNVSMGLSQQISSLKIRKEKKETNLKNKLSKKAKEIKTDENLFKLTLNRSNYTIVELKNEIPNAEKISSEDINKYKKVLEEQSKNHIPLLKVYPQKLTNFINQVRQLLSKEIKPSKTIKYLEQNPELQKWVEQGIKLHRNKRNKCGFCDQYLPEDFWDKIDAHFTKESEAYKHELEELYDLINQEISKMDDYINIKQDMFYSLYQDKVKEILNEWLSLKEKHINNLTRLKNKLGDRKENIFLKKEYDDVFDDVTENIYNLIEELNKLIKKNNDFSTGLVEEQSKAREKLRRNEIYEFLNQINYEDELKTIAELKGKIEELEEQNKNIVSNINQLNRDLESYKSSLHSELAAAKQVNIYLKNFLGHPELSLEAEESEEDEKEYKFVIKRDDEIAYNLSEGEQTLISFCYFLAKLKDIRNPSEYIVFIDDPISSLDNNNIFFIYSLIESEIKNRGFKQVFLSTHNLDFLKFIQYLFNWKDKKVNYYLIEKKNKEGNMILSQIRNMPHYMRKYSTEFVYLFEQIYRVANEEQTDENYYVFYNFHNNVRKFLESYLYFKYPDCKMCNDERIRKFFNEHEWIEPFINRLSNEYSHGRNQPDRLHRPIDLSESKKMARLILDKIKNEDEEQYNSFLMNLEQID